MYRLDREPKGTTLSMPLLPVKFDNNIFPFSDIESHETRQLFQTGQVPKVRADHMV